MILKTILLIIVVIFFAMNMGGSGIAPSFAASCGGKFVKRKKAILLFGLFVILGAIFLGRNVSLTLSKNLVPHQFINFDVVLVILVSATFSLFVSNILKIPQSTSQVTVGAIVGVGLYFRHLYIDILLLRILPMWIFLPLVSYIFTFLLYRIVYPPEHNNFHIYQKVLANEKKLRLFCLIVSCYVAFAIGTNNVANAVGPLFGAKLLDINSGLFLIAPFFGIGAWLIGKGPLETASCEVVPLGLISGIVISFVTATLLIFASILGIPQSLVQLNLCATLAISNVKNGHKYTMNQNIVKKIFLIWSVTPLISTGLAFLLSTIFLRN